MLLHSIRLLRPWQWIKNVFVLAPLMFGHVPKERFGQSCILILCAFIAFCCWSSTIYIVNDLVDRKSDRAHPRKSKRPLAAGVITPRFAAVLAVCCLVGSIAFLECIAPAFPRDGHFGLFLVAGTAFLTNGLCYCLIFRHAIFLDVFSIAIGFVLRVVAGCLMIGVEPSRWLLVCTFTLALFLAFGKRKMELSTQSESPGYRPSLALYPPESLNIFLAVSAAVCLVSYLLYTLDLQTMQLHNTKYLICTVPFVFYGIFRYILASHGTMYDGPDEFILRDRPFQLNLILWTACVAIVLGSR